MINYEPFKSNKSKSGATEWNERHTHTRLIHHLEFPDCRSSYLCSPYNRPRRPRCGAEVQHCSFFNLDVRWGWVVKTTPRPLYPRERPGTHCTGGWVGPTAGLDGCGKLRPPPEFDHRTVQPVASRYTDWAVLAYLSYINLLLNTRRTFWIESNWLLFFWCESYLLSCRHILCPEFSPTRGPSDQVEVQSSWTE
jgi:hypothetical protein